MAAIKCVDHKGKEFPSFKAMCEHWEKKPDTVKRRLSNRFCNWPLEMALEIPEIPGYRFKLVMIENNGTLRFRVKIDPSYVQYTKFKDAFLTFDEIKNNFPMTVKQYKKGKLLGIY